MNRYIQNFIFICIDLLSFVFLLYIALYMNNYIYHNNINNISNYIFIIPILLLTLIYEKIYTIQYDFWQETKRIVTALIYSFFVIFAIFVLIKTEFTYSRKLIILYFILLIIFIPIIKRFTKRVIFSFKIFRKKIKIVSNTTQDILLNEFIQNWYLGLEVTSKDYESVIIVSNGFTKDKLNQEINKYIQQKCTLFVVPYITDINFSQSDIVEYSNIRLSAIKIENKLDIKRNIFIKNIFDKSIAFCASLIFLPFHFIIIYLIKKDSNGDALYKQIRLGKDGVKFYCYKYRTMYQDQDDKLDAYLKRFPKEKIYYEKYHKYRNDPRLTKIGRILRKYSIDEIPQIFNVLKGDMSLIGPRPYMLNEESKMNIYKTIILKAKPGITGLWQVSGRNKLTFKQRNELEAWYVKNWSVWLDIIILLKTVKVIVNKSGK